MTRHDHSDNDVYAGRLKHLVYTSTVSDTLTDDNLDGLLAAARKHNASADITGVLLLRNRTFIQFLEGSAEEIDLLMSRIQRDDRHRNVKVIIEEPAEHRRFSDWRMGFRVPLAPDSPRQDNMRDSFSDLTSDSHQAVIERAAREFSLWFKVTEGSDTR